MGRATPRLSPGLTSLRDITQAEEDNNVQWPMTEICHGSCNTNKWLTIHLLENNVILAQIS